MNTTIDAIFLPEELRLARSTVYAEELRQLRLSSRRAPSPAERVALAEMEQRLRSVYAELLAGGLVNPLPEGLAA